MIYIYALIDPRDNEVRYVGRTEDPENRLEEHISQHRDGMREWVEELADIDLAPRLRILEIQPCYGWRAERYWIQFYLSNGAALLNKMIGSWISSRIPSPLPDNVQVEYRSQREGSKALAKKLADERTVATERELYETHGEIVFYKMSSQDIAAWKERNGYGREDKKA
jgi:hypothetical protein